MRWFILKLKRSALGHLVRPPCTGKQPVTFIGSASLLIWLVFLVAGDYPINGSGSNTQLLGESHIDDEKAAKRKDNLHKPELQFHATTEFKVDAAREMSDADYNWRNLTPAEISRLSVLGRRMFLNEKIGFEQHRNFTIHLWNYDKFAWELGPRFFKIGSPIKFDPFESCSVSNCRVTTKNKDIMDADAVLFHLHLIAGPPAEVRRAPGQLWVWFGDESPYNVLISTNDRNLIHYSGFFNWSMTYRMDSNVPVPYGRAVPLPKDQYLDEIEDYHKLKKKNIALMGWNCGGLNGRYKYLAEMQKYIEIDVYGRCGTLKCEGHYYENCNKLDDYKFYLAFESLNCDEYVTEKAWWNALNKSAVPVVMGAPKHSYQKLLPPNSFIHIDDFKGPEELTQYIKYLLDHPAEYNKYHDWRKRYRVFNEHGYSGAPTRQLCRLCEALNYNNKTNQRADLENYFDHKRQCHDT